MLAQIFGEGSNIVSDVVPVYITAIIVLGVVGVFAMYFYYKSKKDKEK